MFHFITRREKTFLTLLSCDEVPFKSLKLFIKNGAPLSNWNKICEKKTYKMNWRFVCLRPRVCLLFFSVDYTLHYCEFHVNQVELYIVRSEWDNRMRQHAGRLQTVAQTVVVQTW